MAKKAAKKKKATKAKSKAKSTRTTTRTAPEPPSAPEDVDDTITPSASAATRESFLPTDDATDTPPPAATTSTQYEITDARTDDDEPLVLGPFSLSLEEISPRRVRVSITIPPLDAVHEEVFLPARASREKVAAVIGGVIGRIGASLTADGIYQDHVRQEELRESQERYARNNPTAGGSGGSGLNR